VWIVGVSGMNKKYSMGEIMVIGETATLVYNVFNQTVSV